MARAAKTKVFTSGGSQVVVIPPEYRFSTDEVFIRRDPQSGGLILSEVPGWDEIFAALDAVGIPDDFMADRDLAGPQERNGP
jgi:antitoxin VapB